MLLCARLSLLSAPIGKSAIYFLSASIGDRFNLGKELQFAVIHIAVLTVPWIAAPRHV